MRLQDRGDEPGGELAKTDSVWKCLIFCVLILKRKIIKTQNKESITAISLECLKNRDATVWRFRVSQLRSE